MASKLRQPTFETERLRLRPFRKSEAKVLHVLYGDEKNLRYWGVDPSPNLDSTRKMLRWHVSFHPFHYALWAIEEKKSRRVVGMINYHRRDLRERRVDVGWLALPRAQGKGYMTEAGRALLRHLFDTALAKRLGFRLEGGPIRDRWFKDGGWHSVMLYGLIEGEER